MDESNITELSYSMVRLRAPSQSPPHEAPQSPPHSAHSHSAHSHSTHSDSDSEKSDSAHSDSAHSDSAHSLPSAHTTPSRKRPRSCQLSLTHLGSFHMSRWTG